MISTRIVPTGTASATTQQLLVEVTESVCRPYCVLSNIQPTATVSFTKGTVTTINGLAVVPVTATVNVVTPNPSGCGCAHTQLFAETFDVAFTATDANTITLTQGADTIVLPANVKCNKAYGVNLTTSLSITIA